MGFIEGANTKEGNEITTLLKKPFFAIKEPLRDYLKKYEREVKLPVTYDDLYNNLSYSVPIKDKHGKRTEWEKVVYDLREWQYLRDGLINIYEILRTKGDPTYSVHWR